MTSHSFTGPFDDRHMQSMPRLSFDGTAFEPLMFDDPPLLDLILTPVAFLSRDLCTITGYMQEAFARISVQDASTCAIRVEATWPIFTRTLVRQIFGE